MIKLPDDFKSKVFEALLSHRKNYDINDDAYAKRFGLNPRTYSNIKTKKNNVSISPAKLLNIGRQLGVLPTERKWNMARTEVFTHIEEDVLFCKEYSKSMIFVDRCGIGKTYTAMYLSATIKNCFYVDASQGSGRIDFTRALAMALGVGDKGKYKELKKEVKYALNLIPNPIVIIDEAGDLDQESLLDLKGYWNATMDRCGWYMMGAEGLRAKLKNGISNKKQGFAELFSRFSENYSQVVPTDKDENLRFYRKLIADVLDKNIEDKTKLNELVNQCLVKNADGEISGLRRAESVMILDKE